MIRIFILLFERSNTLLNKNLAATVIRRRKMETSKFNTVEKVVERINQIEPAAGAYVSGGRIKGCFRGKGSESYCFMLTAREYEYDNTRTHHVNTAIAQAIAEIYGS